MVEVQKKAFAAVQKAQADEVVPLEAEERENDDAREEREDIGARVSFFDKDLRAERTVAIHVLDVRRERWIGVVEDVEVERSGGASEADGLVYGAGIELRWGW